MDLSLKYFEKLFQKIHKGLAELDLARVWLLQAFTAPNTVVKTIFRETKLIYCILETMLGMKMGLIAEVFV